MDIGEIRRRNLAQAVNEFGSQSAAAEKAGVTVQYLNALLVGSTKAFGERSARKLESAFGLKPGQLDQDLLGGGGGASPPGDEETTRLARRFQALSARDRSAVSALIDRLLVA